MAKTRNHPFNKTWIKDPSFKRVSLVPEGANSEAHIKLFKMREGGNIMNFEQVLALLKPEQAELIRGEVTKAREEVPAEITTKLADLEKTKTEAEAKIVDLEKKIKTPAPNIETDPEELLKNSDIDAGMKAVILAQISKARVAEEAIKKMRDEQDQAEAIAKAKTIPNVVGEETKVAEIFKKLKQADAGLCEEVFEILKSANTLIEKGGIFTEVGKSGEGKQDGSEEAAWSAIEKKAEEISKARSIDQTKAIGIVMNEFPELYDSYIKAQVG